MHSPFLYKLYNDVVQKSRTFRIPGGEDLRRRLREDHTLLEVDHPKTDKIERKSISQIARKSLSYPQFNAFVYLLSEFLGVEQSMETGTSLGVNAYYMAQACKTTTIEGSSVIAKVAFNNLNQTAATVVHGKLIDVFESTYHQVRPQILFLDADHESKALDGCLEIIMSSNPLPDCLVIHDIYWSRDMNQFWKKLLTNDQFVLTVDIFQAGLVFPNIKMEKQHVIMKF